MKMTGEKNVLPCEKIVDTCKKYPWKCKTLKRKMCPILRETKKTCNESAKSCESIACCKAQPCVECLVVKTSGTVERSTAAMEDFIVRLSSEENKKMYPSLSELCIEPFEGRYSTWWCRAVYFRNVASKNILPHYIMTFRCDNYLELVKITDKNGFIDQSKYKWNDLLTGVPHEFDNLGKIQFVEGRNECKKGETPIVWIDEGKKQGILPGQDKSDDVGRTPGKVWPLFADEKKREMYSSDEISSIARDLSMLPYTELLNKLKDKKYDGFYFTVYDILDDDDTISETGENIVKLFCNWVLAVKEYNTP